MTDRFRPARDGEEQVREAERALAGHLARGAWFDAALAAHRAGRAAQAAELFERSQRFAEAANCWYDAKHFGRAIEAALRVPLNHGLFRASARVAFDAAVAMGRRDARLDDLLLSLSSVQLNDTMSLGVLDSAAAYQALVERNEPIDDAVSPSELPTSVNIGGATIRDFEENARPAPMSSLTSLAGLDLGDLFAERFRLDRVLGQGGSATVYLARDVVLDEEVALKVMTGPLSGDAHARLKREIQLARKLTHESIVRVFDLVAAGGLFAISMEVVEGAPLDAMIEDRTLSLPEARNFLVQAAQALAFAHSRGVVHRDVKPENMLITRDGVLKILDFGIAKTTQDASITQTGMIFGTPHYIAPEQIADFKKVDHRADVYALGVVAYQLFTGRVPFNGSSVLAVLGQHMTDAPKPPRSVRPELPAAVDELVLAMLEKDPAKRVSDCQLVALELMSLPFNG